MQIVRDVAGVRAAIAEARAAASSPLRVGLVPTMGAFHEGHLSLIRAARTSCDLVVVWLFVNPTQFNDAADLTSYPRDEARDAELAAAGGADLLFAPDVAEVYPDGHATTITVSGIADVLEGAHRPGHFAGVATVVAKMLNMVQPNVAFFGAKDAQQVAVVRRMITDLNLPVALEVCPTVREPDGLAMSSRNVRLNPDQRRRAAALSRGLSAAKAAVDQGERSATSLTTIIAAVLAADGLSAEYIAVVDPSTFVPIDELDGRALLALAVPVGPVRLIDNLEVAP
ncbi:pantoate--beta-alanine ligase [Propionicimonas paludicola]|uniref:Pantothenate synthetase n=1 Tax=Propionicimonas paludicola TaxID=185243 RepID=A0A2A9CU68_9ACTN|nr:pantoate--beta-alanine ligase [Propionicimonas paludicola]PFG17928.1 pantoate--beta-alanine ligase [Propionicimonas paludicola]